MKTLPVDSIQIGERFRKNLGDLAPLMASISDIGLLHPVVVNRDHVLIAGERRLAACKALGMKRVPVRVIDLDQIIVGEHAENVFRKNFLPSEAVAIARALAPIEREAARKRQQEAGKARGRGGKASGKLPQANGGRTRDRVAAYVGMSYKTLQRAQEIVEAGEQDPDKYGDLVELMDRKGQINNVHRKLQTRREIEIIRSQPPKFPNGRYSVVVVDPPWCFETETRPMTKRNLLPYPSMTVDEIAALPLIELAEDDAMLFLWTTNSHLHAALHVMEAWGFDYKTMITWVKTAMGTGHWLRNITEHALVGVRGRPLIDLTNQTTVIHAGVKRKHSRKPCEFYAMVESLCPGSKVELFGREQRRGWDIHGTAHSATAYLASNVSKHRSR